MRPLLLLAAAILVTAAAPTRDWSATAQQNAGGAFVIGNPAARVKITEWASYTCSHCADFSQQSQPVLKERFIRSGSTNLEIRHLVRDPLDLGAAILARCAGPRGFAGMHAAIFAAQGRWLPQGSTFAEANAERLQTLPRLVAIRQFADGAGLTAVAKARGLTEPQVAACFADQAAVDRLLALSGSAPAEVTATPTFYVNGKLVPNVDWARLEPVLRAAGAR